MRGFHGRVASRISSGSALTSRSFASLVGRSGAALSAACRGTDLVAMSSGSTANVWAAAPLSPLRRCDRALSSPSSGDDGEGSGAAVSVADARKRIFGWWQPEGADATPFTKLNRLRRRGLIGPKVRETLCCPTSSLDRAGASSCVRSHSTTFASDTGARVARRVAGCLVLSGAHL